MVASDEDRQERCLARAAVIFMEVGHFSILRWHCSNIEVILVSGSLLEISQVK